MHSWRKRPMDNFTSNLISVPTIQSSCATRDAFGFRAFMLGNSVAHMEIRVK
jgi:hypothetical protein